MTTLGNLDANSIGRYDETTPIGTEFSDYLNAALDSVSAQVTVDRAAWPKTWTSYNPTLTNITLGTGSSTSYRWRKLGLVNEVEFRIKLGTGGAFGTFPTLSLPVDSAALFSPYEVRPGALTIYDDSAGLPYPGAALADNTNLTRVRLYHTNSGAFTNITPTVPFASTVNDVICGRFTYVPA